jgi:glycosyltransferase involved in cell wall biosynthesis
MDAEDPKSLSGTSAATLVALGRQGVEIVPVYPLNRSFRYLYAPQKTIAALRSKTVIAERFPLVLRSYAREIEQRIKGKHVDIIFSNSSVPITKVRSGIPKMFWTDALWQGMRDYYPGQFGNPSKSSDKYACAQEIEALQNVDLAVYTSEWAAAQAGLLVGRDKIRVVPRGANVEAAVRPEDVGEVLRSRSEDVCTLLFVGVDWHRKGGAFAVEVAQQLNRSGTMTELTVVGCNPPSPMPSFVNVVGFINKRDAAGHARLAQLFRLSHFLLLPTRAEAGGIVFAEASAFAVPSIAFDTGGVSEYVKSGRNGELFPIDAEPALVARCIARLFREKHVYSRLATDSLSEFYSRFSWEKTATSLIDLMATLVRNGSPRCPL